MQAKNKIKISFFTSLILVAILVFIIPAQKNSTEKIEQFWIKKTFSAKDKNIVIAGDSRIYRGVSAKQIESNTKANLKAINLGYSSAGFSTEYLDFCVSKIKKSNKNKILILGITPHSFTNEAFKNEHLKEFLSLSKFEVFKKTFLASFFKLFSPIKLSKVFKRKPQNYIEDYQNDGWVKSSKKIENPAEALASYKRIFSTYKTDDKLVSIFLNKIKKLKSQNIKIIAFRPPTSLAMEKLENKITEFNEQELKNQLIKFGVHWVDFNSTDFKSYDGSHLHYDSAIKLSNLLSREVTKILE